MTLCRTHKVVLVLLFLMTTALPCFAYEIETSYATLLYERGEQLSEFNRNVSLGGVTDLKKNGTIVTVRDEVRYKLDSAVMQIELLLHVCPRQLRFTIVLLSSASAVRDLYKKEYGRRSDYLAFYAPQKKTLFLSARDTDKYVLAHELTHVIVDQYFASSPSAIIHEILAHFVETHIDY